MTAATALRRIRIQCQGTVQGVGFRPTVHRLATALGLAGWVANGPCGATVVIEGPVGEVDRFIERLPASLPPLAKLHGVEVVEERPVGEETFRVCDSLAGSRAGALVPPDAALCSACRREMADPAGRRFRYPFTTCTDCGPRFTLVTKLPYDRVRTSMGRFPLCEACRREYEDPSDRRFHAEPLCCPDCGPQLWLTGGNGVERARGPEAIAVAGRALLHGAIVAVKGLGGFQLACRADEDGPVLRLRQRKRRPTKPFAVMLSSLEQARRLVRLDAADEELLTSPRAPVLLAPVRTDAPISRLVAPGLADLGIMLPTTPLHVELLRGAGALPMVMTSGNLSEEPICHGNGEALDRLAGVADLFLLHDRDIVRPVDDSVVRISPAGPVMVRRSRGWVPEPLPLPEFAPAPVLAVGGHLRSTACVAVDAQAFPSQHVGDLDTEPARAFLRRVIESLEDLLQASPAVIACDVHPDYPSGWLAEELAHTRGGTVLRVQHHLAHTAAVLAENHRFPGIGETALAICLDGTGWGPDGTAWGGEWLAVQGDLHWQRIAHLEPLPLVGGESAVREPWRVAAAALAAAGEEALLARLPMASHVGADRLQSVARLAATGRWPLASGAGRVFEAMGAILGLAVINTWEGEAAVLLESLAASSPSRGVWTEVSLDADGTLPRLPTSRLLAAAAVRLARGEDPSAVAAGFHETFAELAARLTILMTARNISTVALGGGAMINGLLTNGLRRRLSQAGFEVLTASSVPPGDGGLSYGQAVVSAVLSARALDPARAAAPGVSDHVC